MAQRIAKRVLLVGWDATDWQIILPLLDAGKMPVLNGLVDRGVMGNIATLRPCLSPLLWTSIATGKLADKHGILGFVEPTPGGGVRLSTSTSRKTKALWNILSQNGLKTNVVGWFASHPAEPINGVCVSNLFDQSPGPPDQPWPLAPGAVHPERWRDPVADFRVHPAEIAAADLRYFIPKIDEIDLQRDRRPLELAQSLAHGAGVHSVATAIMENEPWDFMAVYYDLMDQAGHHFMPYHPPRMDHIPEPDFELYKDVMERIYLFHDQMLGRLVELAGEDTTVILVSDHGFLNDHHRPRTLPTGGPPEAMAAIWHRQYGILCIAGDAIKPDERVYGATLLDVAPTILMLLGIAPGSDMDGKALTQILKEPTKIALAPSWDDQPGQAGMHPAERESDVVSDPAMIERLVALGYLDPSAANEEQGPGVARDEAQFNLATVYISSNRAPMAVSLLERLSASHPENARYATLLASAYAYAGRPVDAQAAMESIERRFGRHPELDAMLATSLMDQGKTADAAARLEAARQSVDSSMTIESACARLHVMQRNWPEAEQAYRRMLAIESESPFANNGLATVLLELKDFENAASYALEALNAVYHFPAAHFNLGKALEGMGMMERAVKSMETAVSMAPNFVEAHRYLAGVFQRIGDPVRALRHERAAEGHLADDDDFLRSSKG